MNKLGFMFIPTLYLYW